MSASHRAFICVLSLLLLAPPAAAQERQQIIISGQPGDGPMPFPGMGPRQGKTGTGRIRGRVTNPIRDNEFVDIVLREPPLWASWLVLALACAFCLWLLSRKIRAYEVVK